MAKVPLTEQETRILQDKATEPPGSGRFLALDDQGHYCCRQCGNPLFASAHKFESGCGWPSFDDELPGAIRREVDADGRRTEILCAQCGGHLGHVFEGERLTHNNLRHCVNGASLAFEPDAETETRLALFGGGCFWCLEALFQRLDGVSAVQNGYAGGSESDAHYQRVCSGGTGHIEVVQITFDPAVISFGQLLELFFDCHDPTSWDKQGADTGSQYRSAVFCQDSGQRQAVEAMMAKLAHYYPSPLVTEIRDAVPFYPAEPEHDDYFNTHPLQPYCQWNIGPKLDKLLEKYADRLKD